MKYESFTFEVDEYARTLTGHSHQTVYWLNKHGYLNDKQTEELLSRMIVVPVRNSPGFGERLLSRFFGKDSSDNAYVFPITLLDAEAEHQPRKGKPKLEVVE
jgi:hypothetical protein